MEKPPFSLPGYRHITLTLQLLHWLPIKFRVIVKTATLMHQILHNRCPSYLTDLVEFNTANSQRRQLRSSLTRAAVVKRTRTHFGKRAFSVCEPHTWNSLPPAVRNIDSYPAHSSVQTSSQVTFVLSCIYRLTFILFSIFYLLLLTTVIHSRPCLYDWAL